MPILEAAEQAIAGVGAGRRRRVWNERDKTNWLRHVKD